MKRTILLCGILLISCGCEKKITNNTCIIEQKNSHNLTLEMTATNDIIDKLNVTIIPDNKELEIESFNSLNNEQKMQIKNQLLNNLGLNENKKGIDITFQFNKNMILNLNIDLKIADRNVLKKIGFDFEETDMSLKKAVDDLQNNGALCK
ncbi:MAG: hypothetical protein E7172_00750 [Firmicutes bacterium]|nr:hypothetical protein [Bacillota bacterium]